MRTIALTAAALALGGCGGRETVDTLTAAAASTRESGTARTWVRDTVVEEGRAKATLATGNGLVDFRRDRGILTLSAPLFAALVEPGGRSPAPATVSVYDGREAFVLLPSREHPGRPWLRVDRARPTRQSIVPEDPASGLDFLDGPHRSVQALDREAVRGVDTTHYRVDIDLERVAETLPAPVRREARRAFAEGKPRTLAVDVWIDGDGLIRRIRWVDTVGVDEDLSIARTREYFDFGVEVDVPLPPPEQVRLR